LGNRDGLPEFTRLAMRAISKFPDRVLIDMANPETGILRSAKFLPTVAELAEWCNDRHAKICREEDEREREERRKLPPPAIDPDDAEKRKAVADRVRAGLAHLRDELADKPEQYGSPEERIRKANDRLVQLKSDYAATPVRLSPRLLAKIADAPREAAE
jgi:hypothetical protein